MSTAACTEVDVMTIAGMDVNIFASSDQPGVANIIPHVGAKTPDYWSPPASDTEPELKVVLPAVSGIPQEDYDLMAITVTAEQFVSVTVTVINSQNQSTFNVSVFSLAEIHKAFTIKQN